ncbi:glycosyltransferase family 2 protein [Haloglomus halophilum]|uniref:glycosyltransferase family 2 protein n=1 Tax=Haloglomus halophilum TaxID=2962672 RepID=UPI0020C9E6A1|nr:glycosyltransferase family 2 protein [Haloglomus halophilum]
MSGTEESTLAVESNLATDRPAVGVVVTPENSKHLPHAVLRAQQSEYDVLVVPTAGVTEESLSFANQLDAQVLKHASETDVSPTERLVEIGRSTGYPGVIVQDELRTKVDFKASEAALREQANYFVEGVRANTHDEEGEIVVGIPAYNEEVGIGSVILRASEYASEVVVVDDGSTDQTVEVAREAGATVIEHESNSGKGAAVQTLFDHVAGQSFDALVLIDGDGQHVPSDIPQVVGPVSEGESDLVVGSRYLEDSGEDETPRYRRFGQRVLDMLTMGSSRTNVTDSQSGFRAFSPKAVEELELNSQSFGVESEMISEASSKGLDIEERSIDVRYDGIDGQTQNPLRHGLSVVTFLLTLVRDRHPLLFFGLPGLVFFGVGALYGVDAILVYRATGEFFPAKVLVSGFLTILGTLGLFIGLVLNRIGNMIAEIGSE